MCSGNAMAILSQTLHCMQIWEFRVHEKHDQAQCLSPILAIFVNSHNGCIVK